MSKTSNSNWETTVKPIVVLSVISLVVSLLLALVNSMTAPVIAENTKRTTLAAYVGVLPSVSDATELEEVTDYTTANVTGVVKAPDGSLAIKAEESGFDGGIVTVIVGMDGFFLCAPPACGRYCSTSCPMRSSTPAMAAASR